MLTENEVDLNWLLLVISHVICKCDLLGFLFYFFLICRFSAVRYIKLAIPSAFERTLIYRIVSYRDHVHDGRCPVSSVFAARCGILRHVAAQTTQHVARGSR